jgi:hypothetical protein
MISLFSDRSEHVDAQHPVNQENRDNGSRDMNDPVARCFWLAEIEHG